MTTDQRLVEAVRSVLNDPAHRLDPQLVGLEAVHHRAARRRRRTAGTAAAGVGIAALLSLLVLAGLTTHDASELPLTSPSPSTPTDPVVVTDTSALPTCSARDTEFRAFDGPRTVPTGAAYLVRLGYGGPPCALRQAPALMSGDALLATLRSSTSLDLVVRPDDFLDLVITSSIAGCPAADLGESRGLSLRWGGVEVELSDAALPTCAGSVSLSAAAAPAVTVPGTWEWLGWDWADAVAATPAGAPATCVLGPAGTPTLGIFTLQARFKVQSVPPDTDCALATGVRLAVVDPGSGLRVVDRLLVGEWPSVVHDGRVLEVQIHGERGSCTHPVTYESDDLVLLHGEQRVGVVGRIVSCPNGLSISQSAD